MKRKQIIKISLKNQLKHTFYTQKCEISIKQSIKQNKIHIYTQTNINFDVN